MSRSHENRWEADGICMTCLRDFVLGATGPYGLVATHEYRTGNAAAINMFCGSVCEVGYVRNRVRQLGMDAIERVMDKIESVEGTDNDANVVERRRERSRTHMQQKRAARRMVACG